MINDVMEETEELKKRLIEDYECNLLSSSSIHNTLEDFKQALKDILKGGNN